jgi:chorismate mutase/prephenate dehydratase
MRKKIDSVDKQILGALSERTHLAKQIGEYKKKMGLPVIDLVREQQVISRIGQEAAREGLPRERVEEIYREIIRLCRSVQTKEIKVAFLGPQGTFCEKAAREHFKDTNAVFEARPSVFDVFRSVEVNEADSGIVPIENSNEGSVKETLDLLRESELRISGEIVLRISHSLIAKPGTALNNITKIASHPQALAQCQRYLKENFPNVELVEMRSTAAAVKLASESEHVAAIGTDLAAGNYGMEVVASAIEDNRENHTRFFMLSHKDLEPTGKDRTSIMFTVKHSPGSLNEALGALSRRGINLSKIESRPTRDKPWEYIFFCDFEGHRTDSHCREALEELCQRTVDLKILGSYPRAQ